jgi:hypothetical protein
MIQIVSQSFEVQGGKKECSLHPERSDLISEGPVHFGQGIFFLPLWLIETDEKHEREIIIPEYLQALDGPSRQLDAL